MRDHSPPIRCVLRIARRIAAETLTPRMVARTIEYVRAPSSAIWAGVKACSTPSIRTTTGSSTSCAGQAWSSQAPHNPLSAERPLECTSHAASLVMWRPNDRVPSGHMEQFCQHVGPSRRQRHEVMAILFAPKVRPRRLSSWSDAMEDGKAPSCSSHSCRCQSCTGSSGLIRARNPARRGRLRLTTCPRTRCWLPTRTRRKLHSAQMADSCRGGRESMPGQQPRSLNRTPKPSPARWAPTPGGLGSGWGRVHRTSLWSLRSAVGPQVRSCTGRPAAAKAVAISLRIVEVRLCSCARRVVIPTLTGWLNRTPRSGTEWLNSTRRSGTENVTYRVST